MYRYFEASSVANDYLKYRPSYSSDVAERITEYLAEKIQGPYHCALDVGCGSGQFTRCIASNFSRVIGVDVSQAQINAAETADNPGNITFMVAPAEDLPVAPKSVELITSATASHYFDWTVFGKEVDRVLKPNGCLAILGYDLILIDHSNSDVKMKLSSCVSDYTDYVNDPVLNACTPTSYKFVKTHYKDLPLPFIEQKSVDIEIRKEMTVADYIECYKTYAMSVELLKDHPDTKRFKEFQNRILEILGASTPEETKVTAVIPVFIRMTRKPYLA